MTSVGVQITPAQRGRADFEDSVGRFLDLGVWTIFNGYLGGAFCVSLCLLFPASVSSIAYFVIALEDHCSHGRRRHGGGWSKVILDMLSTICCLPVATRRWDGGAISAILSSDLMKMVPRIPEIEVKVPRQRERCVSCGESYSSQLPTSRVRYRAFAEVEYLEHHRHYALDVWAERRVTIARFTCID